MDAPASKKTVLATNVFHLRLLFALFGLVVSTAAHATSVTVSVSTGFYNTAATSSQTGTFTATFDASPSLSPSNAAIALCKGTQTAYTGLSCIARFNPTGDIDAYNGTAYQAASVIPYSAGLTYHFRMVVNVPANTYSVYVTPPGGSELTVGTNYGFRSKVTSLDTWTIDVNATPGGSVTVSNLSVGTQQAATPTFSPAAGTYTSAQTVTISDTTTGATIYYTTNGTTPTTSSSVYSGGIPISSGTVTVEAMATASGMTNSAVGSATYTISPPQQVATPTFSPVGGTYTSAQTVTVSDTTTGATIYYTTNGTTPTTSSSVYSAGIPISGGTVTVEAMAAKSGMTNSTVASSAYTINLPAQVATPTFSPVGGTYTSAQTVTISDTTTGATIYYTTNGTTPTTLSSVYSGGIPISSGTVTVEAMATASGMTNSAVGSATYTIGLAQQVATPTFSPAGGTYTSAQTVAISDTTTGATIYYTTNGTTPTTSSSVYSSAINISSGTVTVEAMAAKSGMTNSTVASSAYTINLPAQVATPTFSPVGGTYTSAQTVTISDTTTGATIYYTTNGTTPTTSSSVYSGGIPISSGTVTVEAMAAKSGMTNSTVASSTYTISNGSVTVTSSTGFYNTPMSSSQAGTFTATFDASPSLSPSNSLVALSKGSQTAYTGLSCVARFNPTGDIDAYNGTAYQAASVIPYSAGKTYLFQMVVNVPAKTYSVYVTPPGGSQILVGSNYGFRSAATSLDTWTIDVSATPGGSLTVSNLTVVGTQQASAPTFSPAAGTYTSAQTVTITSTTSGATIRYTTNGTAPTTTTGTIYSGPISISATATLEAIAYETGYGNSTVTSGKYTINLPPQVAAPTFSPAAGTFTSVQSVSITSSTSGASIRYTTDGVTTPTETLGTLYSSKVSIGITTTLQAIAYETGDTDSEVTKGIYNLPPSTPIFSPGGGTFTTAQSVSITSIGATSIYYTTNGTTPTTSSTLYSGAISISNSTNLQAIGVDSAGHSPVASANYTILPPAPAFSPAPGTYTNVTTFSVTIGDTVSASIYYTTDGSSPTTTSTPYTAPVSLPLGTTTLRAIAANTNGSSLVTSGTYLLTPPPPATPVFSPGGGTFTSAQSVTVTSLGASAIYYTTDGSTPTTSSTLYAGSISIASTTALNAIGVNSGGSSAISSATYTISLAPPPPAPVFTPVAGTYTNAQSVAIICPGADSIYYTTDGSTPTTASARYSGPILISSTATLKAIGVHLGGSSPVGSAAYTLNLAPPAAPIFSPAAGTYTSVQSITITSSNAASIYYTTDGSTPTTASALYNGPVMISVPTTLQAFGVNSGGSGPVASGVYAVNLPPPAAPVFSPGGGTYTSAQTVGITSSGAAAIYYTTDGTTPGTASTLYSDPITVQTNLTLRAVGVNSGGSSAVASAAYTFNFPLPPTPAPVFSIAGGTYTSSLSVTITDTDGFGAVYYTTDGSTPTNASTLLSGAISITGHTTTLQAIDQDENGVYSTVTSATYIINGQVATPNIIPAGGTYTTVQLVDIYTNTAGATVRYTTDGSTPTETNGTVVSSTDVSVRSTTTIKAIAYESGMSDSAVATAKLTINLPTAATPTFSPAAGTYANGQLVTISTTSSEASINYTTDGSTPTATSGLPYLIPVTVSSTTTLKAVTYASGLNASSVASASYTINLAPPAAAPVFSPSPGTFASAQAVNMTSTTSGATIRYTTDGSTPTESNGTVYAGAVSASSSTILKAIAYKSGTFSDSTVTKGIYAITSAPAVVVNVIYDFGTGSSAGYGPIDSVVQGTDGNFYGATTEGGSLGDGAVFKITPAGVLTTLVSFNGSNGNDPVALLQGTDGNFYGTTYSGGSNNSGTVFKLTPSGALTTLASLSDATGAGSEGLMQGRDGNFYGTTTHGGSNGTGTVFAMTPAGALTVLASFAASDTLTNPGNLVEGTDGNFYGTSFSNIFMATPTGSLIYLYNFNSSGTAPYACEAGLIQGSDGNFYGTTYGGGSISQGTIYQLSGGNVTALALFNGANGANPQAGLKQATDGNFYGITSAGGSANVGTIFKMTPNGTITALASFDGVNGDGYGFSTGLVEGSDGNLYGATGLFAGGISNGGVIYQVITLLPPAAPVFNPAGGTYSSAQSVTIASTNASAIYYTTDGSTPTTSSTLYTGPVSFATSTVLNAIGVNSNGSSAVNSASFAILPQAAAPVFSPVAGSYTAEQTVTISSASSGATINYTTDGSTPTETHGTIYSGPIPVVSSETIQALAYQPGVLFDSNVASAAYTINLPQAAAPTFSPDGAFYSAAQTVTMATASSGATICYTTDGSTPTETHGTIYSGPVTIGSSTELQAIAYETGVLADSSVATATYVINSPPSAAIPAFNPAAGSYTGAQTVTLTSTTPNSTIRYTIDGSTPSETNGTVYAGPFAVSATTALQAIAYESGLSDSDVASATYTIQAAAPVFSPVAGVYANATAVAITSATSGATIRYTTDGSTPSEANGTVYSGPVTIPATTTLKAIAYEGGLADSSVSSGVYTLQAAAPVFSLSAQAPVSITIASATNGATIRYTTDGSAPTETAGTVYSGAIGVSGPVTLRAIAYESGFADSTMASFAYTMQVASPVFSSAGGNNISITTTTPGASIRYTTDGNTMPSETVGTLYSSPVPISGTVTLQAIAYEAGYIDSTVSEQTVGAPTITIITPANGSTINN